MAPTNQPLSPARRLNLRRLAARLVLDDGFSPADAVAEAAALVADGVDGAAVLELACQPSDPAQLDHDVVERLFREALAEVGLEAPSRDSAGWTIARWIAESMIAGAVPPAGGALRLWNLWRACGQAGELAEMLQFHDAWEESVGAARTAVEAEMLAFAPEVIAAADRHLTKGDS